MIFATYSAVELQALQSMKEEVNNKWEKKLGYIPRLCYGSEDPAVLWASCLSDVLRPVYGVLLMYGEKYIRLDKYKMYKLLEDPRTMPTPDEVLACRNDNLSDEESMFLINPSEALAIYAMQFDTLDHYPFDTLKTAFEQCLHVRDTALMKKMTSDIEKVRVCLHQNINPDFLKMSPENQAYFNNIERGRRSFELCILPFLLECSQGIDMTDKQKTLNITIDLEALFYGLGCVGRVQALQLQYLQKLERGCLDSELTQITKDIAECYINDPRVLTAHHIGVKPNDMCVCGCGRKWKKHYGNMLDGTLKAVYPKIQQSVAPTPISKTTLDMMKQRMGLED